MPLNAGHAIGVAGPLDCLDHSIRRRRDHSETAPRLENRLVMRAVYLRRVRSGQLREPSARLDPDRMTKIPVLLLARWMRYGSLHIRGFVECRNMLNERAAQIDVQALNAIANRKHGLLRAERVFEKREIRALAVLICLRRFWMPRSVKERGVHIRGTTGENHSIERTREVRELAGREAKRNLDRFAPGAVNRIHVAVILHPSAAKFFFSCAVRDTNPWLEHRFGCHQPLILPLQREPGNLLPVGALGAETPP